MAPESGSPDYLGRNRAHWDDVAHEWVEMGRRAWGSEPSWGEWGVPESELRLLPDVTGMATLEVGCGTGYVSAWLARAGVRGFHVGSSVRPGRSAKAYVDAGLVRSWRSLGDDSVAAAL